MRDGLLSWATDSYQHIFITKLLIYEAIVSMFLKWSGKELIYPNGGSYAILVPGMTPSTPHIKTQHPLTLQLHPVAVQHVSSKCNHKWLPNPIKWHDLSALAKTFRLIDPLKQVVSEGINLSSTKKTAAGWGRNYRWNPKTNISWNLNDHRQVYLYFKTGFKNENLLYWSDLLSCAILKVQL